MPDKAALLAILMLDRPTCVPCLSDKSGLRQSDVEGYFLRMRKSVELHQATERCRVCGRETQVYSLTRIE